MKTVLAILAGLAIGVVVAACGGPYASRPSQMPSVNGSGDQGAVPPGGDAHAEIERLSAEITAGLETAAVQAPEPWNTSAATDVRPMNQIEAVCTPPAHPSGACGDVCTVGTHICDNAERICQLSDELQPDDWAKGKCEDGKKSCEAGRRKCCDCI